MITKTYIWLFLKLASKNEMFFLTVDTLWYKIGDIIYPESFIEMHMIVLDKSNDEVDEIAGFSLMRVTDFPRFLQFKSTVNWTILIIVIFILSTILSEL